VAKIAACQATRRDGSPCRAPALGPSIYCFSHDPAREAQREQARRKGGHNRSGAVRLRALVPPRLLPIFDPLERAMEEVHGGRLEPPRATAMASLARAMVAVLTAGEMEERLRRVEQTVADK
jgi:hypothetical protein